MREEGAETKGRLAWAWGSMSAGEGVVQVSHIVSHISCCTHRQPHAHLRPYPSTCTCIHAVQTSGHVSSAPPGPVHARSCRPGRRRRRNPDGSRNPGRGVNRPPPNSRGRPSRVTHALTHRVQDVIIYMPNGTDDDAVEERNPKRPHPVISAARRRSD